MPKMQKPKTQQRQAAAVEDLSFQVVVPVGCPLLLLLLLLLVTLLIF